VQQPTVAPRPYELVEHGCAVTPKGDATPAPLPHVFVRATPTDVRRSAESPSPGGLRRSYP